jgi:hypothetical protein
MVDLRQDACFHATNTTDARKAIDFQQNELIRFSSVCLPGEWVCRWRIANPRYLHSGRNMPNKSMIEFRSATKQTALLLAGLLF